MLTVNPLQKLKLVWVTSARDKYAVSLLDALQEHSSACDPLVACCENGPFLSDIEQRCADHGIALRIIEAGTSSLEATLHTFAPAFVLLIGYMWILPDALTKKWVILNLHPAPPLGPIGRWQDVIWTLMATEARCTGTMIHVATSQTDRGPVVAYVETRLDGADLESYWAEFRRKTRTTALTTIRRTEGETEPLFARIRSLQFECEVPLIAFTLGALTSGHASVTQNGLTVDGSLKPDGICYNAEVQAALQDQARHEG